MEKNIAWVSTNEGLPRKKYNCGICGSPTTSTRGWRGVFKPVNIDEFIYLCSICDGPTYFGFDDAMEEIQIPAEKNGENLDENKIGHDVHYMYEQARTAASAGAHAASIMAARSALARFAVDMGATPEGYSFKKYVGWLDTNGFVPPGTLSSIKKITEWGGDAAHQIKEWSQEDSKAILGFLVIILKPREFVEKEVVNVKETQKL